MWCSYFFFLQFHVYDSNKYENTAGYQRSLQKTSVPEDGNFGVFALDCEMVYTTRGCEIGRVCLVNQQLEPVSDSCFRSIYLQYSFFDF